MSRPGSYRLPIGGVPPREYGDGLVSPVEPEDEDVYDIRTSLENDLQMYGDIIESYRDHIELAAGFGDHTTAHMMLKELEEHAHVIHHYLADDTIVLESATH